MAPDQSTKNKEADAGQFAEHDRIDDDGDKDAAVDAATKGQTATGYETLSLWETVKTFKLATAICVAASFSAATDGYQIG